MSCRLCGSPRTRPELAGRDYYLTQEAFSLLRCTECGVVFTDVTFGHAEYERYYPKAYYAHVDAHLQEGLREIVQRDALRMDSGERLAIGAALRARLLIRLALVQIPFRREARFLDVGCGAGKLLGVAKRLGYRCYGVEPGTAARALLERNGIKAYESIDSVGPADGEFDIVLFNQSLEHFAAPAGALRKAASLLSPSGVMIVSVPNYGCNDRVAFGAYWRHLDLPRHLFHFTPASFRSLAQSVGLQESACRYKFWGWPKETYRKAREANPWSARLRLVEYFLRQILSFVLRRPERYGSMMAFYLKRSSGAGPNQLQRGKTDTG
ncbi:MAG: class I SAM-dependent methyltransferase [Acidiferrobacteraceae bacterium]